jgi:hypothetical protein
MGLTQIHFRLLTPADAQHEEETTTESFKR